MVQINPEILNLTKLKPLFKDNNIKTNNFLEVCTMVRGKAGCEQIQALITDIFKSIRSYNVIFSDIIDPTSAIKVTLQKWPKSVNYTDNNAKR